MRLSHRYTDKTVCNPARIRTKINYKTSITPYIVAVKLLYTIYRYFEWQMQYLVDGSLENMRGFLYINRDQNSIILQHLLFLFQAGDPADWNHSQEKDLWRGMRPDIHCQEWAGGLSGNKSSKPHPVLSSSASPEAR